MGGSTHETQQTQQVQQNTIDPEQKALLMGNYATAQGNAQKLDTPYGGLLTAAFNPTQNKAQGLFASLSADPSFMNAANRATSAIGGVMGSPLSGNINPGTYSAGQLAGTDLSPYMDPFHKDVIDATMAQLGQQRGQQQVADNASATAAHAFGGSRQAVQNALTTEGYDRNTGGILAGLNSDNFRQAQAAAAGDIGARNQAGQFNATQDQNAQQQSFGNNLAAQNMTLNAAGQLQNANNNALGVGMQQAGILGSVGDVQQQQEQTGLSNDYQNWLTGNQLSVTGQQMLNSALGLMPNQQTVTTNGTGSANKSTNPGVSDIMQGVGAMGMGLGSMGLGFADVPAKVLRFDRGARRWASFRYIPEASDLSEAA